MKTLTKVRNRPPTNNPTSTNITTGVSQSVTIASDVCCPRVVDCDFTEESASDLSVECFTRVVATCWTGGSAVDRSDLIKLEVEYFADIAVAEAISVTIAVEYKSCINVKATRNFLAEFRGSLAKQDRGLKTFEYVYALYGEHPRPAN